MSSKADIWMPLFIGDYLADTSRMTTEQHGAYLLLIMDYWRNGPPPDDDAVLANIAKASAQAWKKIKPAVVEKFRIVSGKWTHRRIDLELLVAEEGRGKAIKKAKQGADARWSKQREMDASRNAPSITPSIAPSDTSSSAVGNASSNAHGYDPSNAQAMLKQCPSPSPSQTKKNQGQKPCTAFAVPEWISPEIWASYLKTRTKRRASNDPVALGLVVEQLELLQRRGHDPRVVLGNSVRGGYGEVFEPKGGSAHVNGYESTKDKSRREAHEILTGKKAGNEQRTIDITPSPDLLG